jgi:cellulose synthase/poly-beta-1,6-N-acetylglucosamine synthase-like glycosyltransferase
VGGNRTRGRVRRFSDSRRVAASPLTIPVSVVIPAYNEEIHICNTVHSVLGSQFPEFEVIVVDDGSQDGTLAALIAEFQLEPQLAFHPQPLPSQPVRRLLRSRLYPELWVISKQNGGKADACNAGANLARYRYVLMTDADCVFEPDTLLRTMGTVNFGADRIIGVGGTRRVLNGAPVETGIIRRRGLPRRWVERFQALEYASAFLTNRLGWSRLNCVPVLSGAFSAWRRDALLELGGWSRETTHEDMDLTIRAHELFRRKGKPYAVMSLPDPVIWTEVPHTWRGLYVQRKRWQRVAFETVWMYRRMLFNPRYGTVGLLGMPYLLVFEALGPFFELAAYLLTVMLFLSGQMHTGLFLTFLTVSLGLNALMRLTALVVDLVYYEDLSLRDLLTLSLLAALEFVIYRPVILLARLVAFPEFLRGHRAHERAHRERTQPPVPQAA